MAGGAFEQERVSGIPVLVDHHRGATESLGDGLVVPVGAVLLGAPLKVAHPLSNVRRWTGHFVVTGSFLAAVQDLRAQLAALGYRVSSWCERVGDAVTFGLAAVKDQPVGERRLVWAEAARAPAAPGRPPDSWLFMELTAERSESVAVRDWGSLIVASDGPVEDVPLPTGWPDLPVAGEALFPAPPSGYPEVAAMRVPRGTCPLGPPVRSRMILVQPDGDVADTFDDLVATARDAIGKGAMTIRAPDADEDGVRVRFMRIGLRTGDQEGLLITATEQDGNPSYVVLEASAGAGISHPVAGFHGLR